jgi:diguanylate cyclase (GGDEF)-like protein/PAS domain S-box-containing protein
LILSVRRDEIKNIMCSNPNTKIDDLVSNIPVGVFQFRIALDGQMVFDYANPQFCEMLSVSADDLYNDAKIAFQRIHPDEIEEFRKFSQDIIQSRKQLLWEGRIVIENKIRWLRIASIPELQENGDVIWSGVQMDITERMVAEKALQDANDLLARRLDEIEKLQSQLHNQAVRDYLTGLYNRRYLDETMEREIARSKREGRKLSVVMIDIDQFKGVNDIYGHQTGDAVLIALGRLLKESSRSSDIACRYGGDEFVVVMLNASDVDAYKRAMQWLQDFAHTPFKFNGKIFSTTLSMGIATFPSHGSSPQGIYLAADEALYHSKKYNNRVTISRRTSTARLSSIG